MHVLRTPMYSLFIITLISLCSMCHLHAMEPQPRTIFTAVRHDDIAYIQAHIKAERELNGTNVAGFTALHLAVCAGKVAICKLLVNAGANVNFKDINSATALHHAAERMVPEICSLLIQAGADREARDKCGATPLMYAASAGRTDMCKLLLTGSFSLKTLFRSDAASISACDAVGSSALHYAAYNGHAQTCHFLLSEGATAHKDNELLELPLHSAANRGHVETAALLLVHGSPYATPDSNNQLPIHLAAQAGHTDIVAMLLRRGSPLEVEDSSHCTPLVLALKKHHSDLALKLLDSLPEADLLPSTKSFIVNKSLPYAATCGLIEAHLPLMHALRRRGANVDAILESRGWSSLELVQEPRHDFMGEESLIYTEKQLVAMKYLIAWGSDIHRINRDGHTPLSKAIDSNRPEYVRAFLTMPQRIPPVFMTVLLMYKFRKDSYIGQMNKDVFRGHLLPLLIEDAVEWHLGNIKTTLETQCVSPAPWLPGRWGQPTQTPQEYARERERDQTVITLLDASNCNQLNGETENNMRLLLSIKSIKKGE